MPQVVQTNPIELETQNHRGDLESCPFCDLKQEDWHSKNTIVVLNPTQFFLPARVIIIDECPKCFEKSWVHNNLRSLAYLDIGFTSRQLKMIDKEIESRQIEGIRGFQKSKCASCSRLTELNFDNFYPFTSCQGRSGRAEKECSKWSAL